MVQVTSQLMVWGRRHGIIVVNKYCRGFTLKGTQIFGYLTTRDYQVVALRI